MKPEIIVPNESAFRDSMKNLVFRKGRGLSHVDFETRLNHLKNQIRSGEIEDFDSKFRYDGYDIESDRIVVYVGITTFQEYRAAFKEDKPDLLQIGLIKSHAMVDYEDQWAELARPLGITAIVSSADNIFYFGLRSSTTEYINEWHSAAGYVPFNQSLNIPIEEISEKFVKTNMNIDKENIRGIETLLIASHPVTGETDIVTHVETNLDHSHFTLKGNWSKALRADKFKKLAPYRENMKLVYPSQAAMDFMSR